MNLYKHQREGVAFLTQRKAAMLCDEMGLGKTRQALVAAQQLFSERKIDRVLVLAPAAVRISWYEELVKLEGDFIYCIYNPKLQTIYGARVTPAEKKEDWKLATKDDLPVVVTSYALLPRKPHVEVLSNWCSDGKTLLICDESSFLKTRTAKQSKGSAQIARACRCCWLLTGTPISNSPLDLYGQAMVMADGQGPLRAFRSFYHFRARYAVLKLVKMGQVRFQQVVSYQNLPELTKRFAPYVLRREKKDCLDLPEKSYTVREVALDDATWHVYQELKREAMLALPDTEERPEPNAAVRLLRLCQLTSGYVSGCDRNLTLEMIGGERLKDSGVAIKTENDYIDVSSEKLDWLVSEITDGELSSCEALIVWCRWRRERERLQQMLATHLEVYRIFGGQSATNRSADIQAFQTSIKRRVLVAQVHAGGFGLNLTAASTAVYLSNSFSYTDRIQSEDRCHRIGQKNAVSYVDVVAVGPKGQRTVDHHVLDCLRAKKDVATLTCSAWKRVLNED